MENIKFWLRKTINRLEKNEVFILVFNPVLSLIASPNNIVQIL